MTSVDRMAEALVGALGSAALKAAVLVILAAVVTRCLRRRSAAVKHLVWTSALGATLSVLILPAVLPVWCVIPAPAVQLGVASSMASAASATAESASSAPGDFKPSSLQASSTPAGSRSRFGIVSADSSRRGRASTAWPDLAALAARHWPSMALALWLAGVIVVFVQCGWSSATLSRLSRRSHPLHLTACGRLAQQIAGDMRIARSVSVLSSDDVELPLAWGLFRARVVLPGDASEWDAERCRYVLQHELAHVRRLDAGTQLVAQAASGIFWFHPLVWYAARRMRDERERACDDCVLSQGARASKYASDLLALVKTYGQIDRHPVALAMARRSQFEGRLLAVLDPAIDRAPLSARRVACVIGVSVALVVPVAAIGSAARAAGAVRSLAVSGAQSAPGVAVMLTPPTAPIPAIRRRPLPEALDLQDVFAGCGPGESSHEHSDLIEGQTIWSASGRDGNCSFTLTSEGDVAFNQDVTAIDRISPGGVLDATTIVRGDVTRLVARGSSAGAVTYEFSRNGQPADFSAAGHAWLEQFLVVLDRHTAFAIEPRLPLLLHTGGPMPVLDEIDRMRADHAKTLYLTRLVDTVPLGPDALRRAAEAAATMSSDHDVVTVLADLARLYRLPDPTVRTILDTVPMLRDDHDKVQMLLAVADTQRVAGALRDEYVRGAAAIWTDRERNRALAALAKRGAGDR